jgi:hypothetical protein
MSEAFEMSRVKHTPQSGIQKNVYKSNTVHINKSLKFKVLFQNTLTHANLNQLLFKIICLCYIVNPLFPDNAFDISHCASHKPPSFPK